MVRVAAFLSVVAVCGAVSGCGDPPEPIASVDAFCDGVCTGANRCDSRVLVGGCYQDCRTDTRNQSLAFVRPESAAVISACIKQSDCATISSGRFEACWDRAREGGVPSAHAVEFCPAYATSAFECGYWFSVEDCEADFSVFTDPFLDAAAACTQLATCAAKDTCLNNLFGAS